MTPGHYGFVHWVLYGIPASTRESPKARRTSWPGRTTSGMRATAGRCRWRAMDRTTTFWVLASTPRRSSWRASTVDAAREDRAPRPRHEPSRRHLSPRMTT
ncbi:MAG: hypothetical protein R3E53_04190 [Myxococcota bacterium]